MSDEDTSYANGSLVPDKITRFLAILGLVCAWLVGTTALILGCKYWREAAETRGAIAINSSTILREILPLGVNVVTTIVTEALGIIHATSLRWQLGKRLVFNSNLRLLTRAEKRGIIGPWGLLTNILHLGLLAVSYCAGSFIFVGYPSCNGPARDSYYGGCSESSQLQFSPGGLVALGVGLLGQALIVSWQIYEAKIPTWSTEPLETAATLVLLKQRTKELGRCMMAVHDKDESSQPKLPRSRQQCAYHAHREVRTILYYLWAVVALVLAWFIAVLAAILIIHTRCTGGFDGDNRCYETHRGASWSLLPDTNGATSYVRIATVGGVASVPKIIIGTTLAFIVMLSIQSTITIGLHCIELIVIMSRDEDLWRKAYTTGGSQRRNALVIVFTSWKSIALLCSKPVIHWLFGLAMSYYLEYGIINRPPQILYLMIFLTAVVGMATYLCFQRPSGPQPATFGHLQTLINLVDEWPNKVYWGAKGFSEDGTGHAGTANHELEKIAMDQYYSGLHD